MASNENKNLGNIEEEIEEQEAAKPNKERNAGNEVLRDEFNKLRYDVDKMSKELKSAVDELKKSIVDIRSAISEIENPFNLLRSISSEEDLKKLERKRLPPGVKSLVLGKPEEEVASEEEKPEEKPRLLEEEKPELPRLAEPVVEDQRRVQLHKSRYLDWVWSLLDSGLSADDVLQFAQACEFTGYLPTHSSEYIYSLALSCERIKLKGFKKTQMLLNMYRGAVISGIEIGSEDLERLISIAEGRLKRGKAERTK